jgi:5-deoxy-glucuronate isomerase
VLHDGVLSTLEGRRDVFERAAGATLLPVGADATVRAADGGPARVAVATARTDVACEAATIGSSDVVVEIRGAGDATRVVRRYALGGPLLPHRLLVVEVLTPSGNWSSYPPHKHDVHADDERELEEIYYFEARSRNGGPGHGYHRQDDPTAVGGELLARVTDGDVALVPGGYHGPCSAPPGHDLYYLNVMAGPVADGSWLTTDDPALAWVRRTWEHASPDERIGPGGELT